MYFVLSLEPGGVAEYRTTFWQIVAHACRYGHQNLVSLLGPITIDRLMEFNEAVQHWIKAEASRGTKMFNRED